MPDLRSTSPRAAAVMFLVIALMVSAPAVHASGHVTARALDESLTAAPGDAVAFAFNVSNGDSFTQDVTFEVDAPTDAPGPATPDPETMSLESGESRDGVLRVDVPGDAPDNTWTYRMRVIADGPLSEPEHVTTLNFTLRVAAPEDADASGHATFSLSTETPELEGVPGDTLDAKAVLRVDDARGQPVVALRALTPSAWPADAATVTPSRVTLYSDWSRDLAFTVHVPEDAETNVTRTAEIHAVPDDGGDVRVLAFTVHVRAPPEAPPEDAGNGTGNDTAPAENATAPGDAPDGDGDGTGEGGDASREEASAPGALTLTLEDPAVEIAPGARVTGTVHIANPDDAPREVTVTGDAPDDGWRLAFDNGGKVTAPANGTVSLPFSVTAAADAAPGSERVVRLHAGDATVDLSLSVVAPATPPATPEDAETNAGDEAVAPLTGLVNAYGTGPVLAAAGAIAAVGGGAFLRGAPDVRRHLWWVGVGLYTRLTRPKLLEHSERERLYHAIDGNPGIHFHALQRELSWNTGALTYHLRVLERHQMITSRRDGIRRRFYLVGRAPRTMPTAVTATGEEVDLSGLRGNIMNAVRGGGEVAQSRLADDLGTSKQALNYHVKKLERLGLLRVERRGRETVLHPAEDVRVTGMDGTPAGAVPHAGPRAAGSGRALADGDDAP